MIRPDVSHHKARSETEWDRRRPNVCLQPSSDHLKNCELEKHHKGQFKDNPYAVITGVIGLVCYDARVSLAGVTECQKMAGNVSDEMKPHQWVPCRGVTVW